jgi:hypothetical protein
MLGVCAGCCPLERVGSLCKLLSCLVRLTYPLPCSATSAATAATVASGRIEHLAKTRQRVAARPACPKQTEPLQSLCLFGEPPCYNSCSVVDKAPSGKFGQQVLKCEKCRAVPSSVSQQARLQ